jgi:hypothetical protein
MKRYLVVTISIHDDNDYNDVLLATDDLTEAMTCHKKEKDMSICIDGYHIAVIDFIDNKLYQDGLWYDSQAKRRVEAEDLSEGLLVVDKQGNKGIVRDCKDLHNVHITYEGEGMIINCNGKEIECGGSSFNCFIESCDEYSTIIDPLFFR